jgi:hypothetical protein
MTGVTGSSGLRGNSFIFIDGKLQVKNYENAISRSSRKTNFNGTSGKNQQRREYILYFPRLKQAPVVKRDHYIHTVLYPGAPFHPQAPALEMDPDTWYYLCHPVHDQHVLFRENIQPVH